MPRFPPEPSPPCAQDKGTRKVGAAAAVIRWTARQFLMLAGVSVVLTLLLVGSFGNAWKPTLVYSFCISLGCGGFIHSFRRSAGWARKKVYQRMGWAHDGSIAWPGWPLMMICLIAGTTLGYGSGTWLGNHITGLHFKGPFDAPWQALLGTIGFSLLPGIALTFIFLWRGKAAAAEARAETLRRQAAETQLRLLESQLEPHMLFNTLANLRVLIGMDAARAQAMLDHLIAFLRATLVASQADRHALRDEFARLEDYLALMQVRMGQRLRFEFVLPAEVADIQVPPLLLQPLVENAIKHGLEPHVAGGLLQVRAARVPGGLRLEVADNGAGYAPAATPTPGSGFGTRQIRERLAVVYGAQARLEIQARPEGGTRAVIDMPAPPPPAAPASQPPGHSSPRVDATR
ncbi:histidine kinase [Roseateles sp. SL47]|uniref:sensor histidine kinase n=1 Tax=Roseateles sp. SL47 TaxID=2995138 RepID=UPI002270176C|nr:histidine kinase [Roseateles sp. SL47]WAC75591.1 histidine kinase [Roseateles sp. SL47]